MKEARKKFLATLKAEGIRRQIPNVTLENAQVLHFLVRTAGASSVLEIGSANGYSTIVLADAIEDQPSPRLLTIDHSEPAMAECRANITAQNLDHIVEARFGKALDILENLEEKFDIIFIDAEKKAYADFWLKCKKLMHERTLVIVDDVLKFPEKTRAFHDLMTTETAYEKVILPTDPDDGIMLIRQL